MADNAQDTQEDSSKDQLIEEETSAVDRVVGGGREASNGVEDSCSEMAGKGGEAEQEDDAEASESGEQDQTGKEKVSFTNE